MPDCNYTGPYTLLLLPFAGHARLDDVVSYNMPLDDLVMETLVGPNLP